MRLTKRICLVILITGFFVGFLLEGIPGLFIGSFLAALLALSLFCTVSIVRLLKKKKKR